ncbi:MAG: PorT family protein [Saprospiraceae bacterium]|nr:PorT family protein [Saprospiraceae bacterium]
MLSNEKNLIFWKIIVCQLFLFGFGVEAIAQLSIRPQAGFNSSTLTKDLSDSEFRTKLGFQFGLDVQIGDRIYFEPGLFWESNKNELEERLNGIRNGFDMQRLYVPLMVGVRLFGSPINEIFDLRFFTGPTFSYTVQKNLKDVSLLEKDDFKDALLGWSAGMGFDASVIFIDIDYSFGISDALEGSVGTSGQNIFHANAGIRIEL